MLRTWKRRRPVGRRDGWRRGGEERGRIKIGSKFGSKREEMQHMILSKKVDIKEFEGIHMVVMDNQINNQLNNQTHCNGWI